MPSETASTTIDFLEKQFGRKFLKPALAKIWPDLILCPPKAIIDAADKLILTTSYLPAADKLLAAVQHEAKEIRKAEAAEREKEWQKQKGDRRDGSIFSQEYSDEYAKLSMKALRFMLSSATHAQKLECMRAMAIQFPHTEWGKKGAELQKEWEAENRNGAPASEDGAGAVEPS